MSKFRILTILNWGGLILLYILFAFWHGAFEGSLSSDEVNNYVNRYQKLYPEGDVSSIRKFLEEDDGKPVVMVNTIKVYNTPIKVNGKSYGKTAKDALDEYMSFVGPYLIKRGSYPIYTGEAVMQSIENWGLDNASEWSSGALVRYRSRRVMMEMVTDPTFDKFHDAKIAAMEKTISYPVVTTSSIGSLDLTVGLILLSLALSSQLFINYRKLEKREKHEQ